MRIAICDDEKLCRDRVLNVFFDYAEERGDKDLSAEVFTEPKALLSAIDGGMSFDLYILDIVMPEMNGIELGRALRDVGQTESKIIYLTSSEDYALDSFRVRAFDYLIKPIEREPFFRVMDEALNAIHIKRDKVLLVKTKEGNTRITFDSILFAENTGRVITYRLKNGKTVTGTTLRTSFPEAVSDLLADKRFALCGASMAANLYHITKVEAEGIVFGEEAQVYLGKKACRELRTVWNNFWLSEEV